jgi:hypothetical protein
MMQALALMAAFKDEWPCLIIVPSSLRGAEPLFDMTLACAVHRTSGMQACGVLKRANGSKGP